VQTDLGLAVFHRYSNWSLQWRNYITKQNTVVFTHLYGDIQRVTRRKQQ